MRRRLLAGIRPVLVASRLEDPPQKVGFQDDHWAHVAGGRASVEVTDQAIYLLVSLRNVGNGLAVLDRWELMPDRVRDERAKGEEESFRRLTRDIYVAPGDLGFWQGTLRDPNEDLFKSIRKAAEEPRAMTLDILYRDHEGGQRTITRFGLIPSPEGKWLATVRATGTSTDPRCVRCRSLFAGPSGSNISDVSLRCSNMPGAPIPQAGSGRPQTCSGGGDETSIPIRRVRSSGSTEMSR